MPPTRSSTDLGNYRQSNPTNSTRERSTKKVAISSTLSYKQTLSSSVFLFLLLFSSYHHLFLPLIIKVAFKKPTLVTLQEVKGREYIGIAMNRAWK